MSDLADFLLYRIAEDESLYDISRSEYGYGWKHMLADCEAKRRIVEDCEEARQQLRLGADYGLTYYYGLLVACQTFASVYADHPDYREEWKP